MSKDAELLRAIGLGPDAQPYWYDKIIVSVDARAGSFPQIRHTPMPGFHGPALGLDLPESEWTVEHDAAFARWVWPWLRMRVSNYLNNPESYAWLTVLGGQLRGDRDSWRTIGEWAEVFLVDPHPGPVMCRAIHAALCGEKKS